MFRFLVILMGLAQMAMANTPARVCEGIFIDPATINGTRLNWYFSIYRGDDWNPLDKEIQLFLKQGSNIAYHVSIPAGKLTPYKDRIFNYKNPTGTGNFIGKIKIYRHAGHSNVRITAYGPDLVGGDSDKTLAFQVGDENFSLHSNKWRKTVKGYSLQILGDVDDSFCDQGTPLIDDPARIDFDKGTNGLDRFRLDAGLSVNGDLTFNGPFVLKLKNSRDQLINYSLDPSLMITEMRHGKPAYKYLNSVAKSKGGISELRMHFHDNESYSIDLEYFGDLSKATEAFMRVDISAGQNHFNAANWKPRYDSDGDLLGWLLTKFMN